MQAENSGQNLQVQQLPAKESDRIISLDVLRGVAVLGILLMNIQAFSMIGAAYINPLAYGDLTDLNLAVWLFSHVFADQKFISIFSMLFGAGILLMNRKSESSRGIHYRRMLWLMVFGLMHAYLLWYGDILFTYAICGMILYVFRNSTPRKQLIWAAIFLLIPFLLFLGFGFSIPSWPEESIRTMEEEGWRPSQEAIQTELDAYRGTWLEQMPMRAQESFYFQTFLFLMMIGWKASALMLIGMAFFQLKILTAERSSEFYKRLVIVGLLIGLPIILLGVYKNFQQNWDVRYSFFFGGLFNYMGSVAVAFSWVGLVMLMVQSNCCAPIKSRFAAVGRMAFTNYILQTLICTTIFYGHGFGLFGSVSRIGQFLITLSVWIVILLISPIWLKHFHFGPLEWLWRSLTYQRAQPFVKREGLV